MNLINTSFELRQITGLGAYIKTLLSAMNYGQVQYKEIELILPQKLRFKYIWQIV